LTPRQRFLAVRLAFGGGGLAGFHHLLEAAQVLLDLVGRIFAHQPGQGRSHDASRRIVLQLNLNFGSAAAGRRLEMHGPRRIHTGAFQRSPSNELVRLLVDNFRVPFHDLAPRTVRDPVGALVIEHRHAMQVAHEARKILQISPEIIQLLLGRVDGDGRVHANTVLVGNADRLAHPAFDGTAPERAA